MDNNNQQKSSYAEVWVLALGELIVSAITVGVFFAIGKFDYRVITGALLGSLVMIGNMWLLSFSVNRAVNKYLEERGEGEMDEEQAQEFAAKHVMAIRMAASKSYLIRTACMVATLLVGLFVGVFNAVATVVPLLAYRPILYISEFVRKKKEAKG